MDKRIKDIAIKRISSLIFTGFGINCEEEMAAAYKLVGAEAQIIHLNDIFNEKYSIHEFDIVNFPGGFSFGDDLGSAKVLANKLKYKKMKSGKFFIDELVRFIKTDKYILGVCNGFQLLVKMGLLPNVNENLEQEVTLTYNDSGKFENRWCRCIVNKNTKSPFIKGISSIELPVRHGEGKLVVRDENIRESIIANSLNCLSYCDKAGNITLEYPLNPNGSELGCAGLTNSSGQILGLMPHPEAYISLYNHPNWAQLTRHNPNLQKDGAGLNLFKNITNHLVNSR